MTYEEFAAMSAPQRIEPGTVAYVDFGGDLGIRILHPLALVRE